MKKNFILIVSLLFYGITFSQVGINTQNPQHILHIDAGGDNDSSLSEEQQMNDFVVTTDGSVGIGTINPATKLDINNGSTNGAIKIVDGTQGDSKVLTSDANGVGTWQSPMSRTISGVTPAANTPYGTSADKYMNSYIDLPEGKWIIFLGYLVNGATAANTRYASRFTLSSSQTSILNDGFTFINNNKYVLTQISNGTAGAVTFGMFASGIIRVEVTKATRLYLWDNGTRNYGTVNTLSLAQNGENYLFAMAAS